MSADGYNKAERQTENPLVMAVGYYCRRSKQINLANQKLTLLRHIVPL